MPNIGVPELLIVLAILLVVFGPKRLPGLGRQLGTGMREFKDSIAGKDKADGDLDDEDDEPPRAIAGLPAERPADAVPVEGEAVPERRA